MHNFCNMCWEDVTVENMIKRAVTAKSVMRTKAVKSCLSADDGFVRHEIYNFFI